MKDLADLQSSVPQVQIPIDRVGVNGLVFRLRLRDRETGVQEVSAKAALAVDLPADRRGTHMSRLVEILDAWQEDLGCQSMRRLLQTLRERLHATRACATFDFSYLLRRVAPVSGVSASMAHDCRVCAMLDGDNLNFFLTINVPIMTVCPCSLAISEIGAHCQRAMARVEVEIERFIWLEELVELAECAGSSPVYPALKREDEKYVTEHAFAKPVFVEDAARAIAAKLQEHPHVLSFTVRVESMESIHNHNAFAVICSGGKNGEM